LCHEYFFRGGYSESINRAAGPVTDLYQEMTGAGPHKYSIRFITRNCERDWAVQ